MRQRQNGPAQLVLNLTSRMNHRRASTSERVYARLQRLIRQVITPMPEPVALPIQHREKIRYSPWIFPRGKGLMPKKIARCASTPPPIINNGNPEAVGLDSQESTMRVGTRKAIR